MATHVAFCNLVPFGRFFIWVAKLKWLLLEGDLSPGFRKIKTRLTPSGANKSILPRDLAF